MKRQHFHTPSPLSARRSTMIAMLMMVLSMATVIHAASAETLTRSPINNRGAFVTRTALKKKQRKNIQLQKHIFIADYSQSLLRKLWYSSPDVHRGKLAASVGYSDENATPTSYQKPKTNDIQSKASIPVDKSKKINKLESKLLKNLRQLSLRYNMIENNDHIMVCISGGKDSATLLHLLLLLQSKLKPAGVDFKITAVHLNQVQPGYNNTSLVQWLDTLDAPYEIVTEDTYTIVKEKTPENKAYCSLCSRLRRGILYTIASNINATKIALGHHGDDAIETLLLNMVHSANMKSMPARYYSKSRHMHVIRPLLTCLEDDIRQYAALKEFPILPCNLCGSQSDAPQNRNRMKLLCDVFDSFNPNGRKNMIRAMSDVRVSHLMDEKVREACGLDGVTGQVVDAGRAALIGEHEEDGGINGEKSNGNGDDDKDSVPLSFIEKML